MSARIQTLATTYPFYTSIVAIILAIFLFDVQGVIIKFAGQDYAVSQIALLRNLLGIVPTWIALRLSGSWRSGQRQLKINKWPLALVRGLMIAGAQLCFYFAIIKMELATATTLAFAGPLFITSLSVPLLGHRVGLWRSLAVIIGFAGVLLVIRPGINDFNAYLYLPLGAAFFYALASVTSRFFDNSTPTALINLYSSVGATFGTGLIVWWTKSWQPIPFGFDWLWFGMMGMTGGCAVLLMISAYRRTEPSSLSPFEYFGIPFSFTLGWIFFDEAPFEKIFPGVLLIVGGGLLVLWREHVISKQAKKITSSTSGG